MAPAPAAPLPDMNLLTGCMLIGVFMNVFLYGMSVVQGYMYFTNFKSDKLFMKVFVGVLLLADTLNCVLDTGFIYQYTVSYFGDYMYASRANPMFAADPVLTAIIAFACQCFFAWRVYRLMHAWWCPLMIVVVGGVSLLSAIGTTIGVQIVVNFAEFQKFQVVVILWLACAALADLIITVALVWTLNKSRTGFTATDDVITRLIRGTIQTGMATTVFAITDLILFVASTTTLHLVFNLPLAKLYVNSLLSTLNARSLMSNQANRSNTHDISSNGGGKFGSSGAGGNGITSTFRKNGAGRQSRFNPTGSATDTFSGAPQRGVFFNKNGNSRLDLEHGIQVTTVEERFEEPHESTQMGALTRQDSDLHHQLQDESSHLTPVRHFASADESRETLRVARKISDSSIDETSQRF
ncbi:unnamed protein product [Sympodiomycopsis kandeliae]